MPMPCRLADDDATLRLRCADDAHASRRRLFYFAAMFSLRRCFDAITLHADAFHYFYAFTLMCQRFRFDAALRFDGDMPCACIIDYFRHDAISPLRQP